MANWANKGLYPAVVLQTLGRDTLLISLTVTVLLLILAIILLILDHLYAGGEHTASGMAPMLQLVLVCQMQHLPRSEEVWEGEGQTMGHMTVGMDVDKQTVDVGRQVMITDWV